MRRAARLAGVLAVAALVTTGCSVTRGGADAGDCFETGSVAAFDWKAEVGCDDPHSVEVFATAALTGTLAGYPRSELEVQGSEARRLYLDLVTQLCEPRWSEYTGYDQLAPQAPDAVVLPALYGDMAVEAAPAERWDAGDKRVVCYQVFGRPGDGGEQALLVERRVLAGLATSPDVPLDVRDCALSPTAEQGERKVSCREEHDREYLGHLDLAQFVGITPGVDRGFLDRFNSTTAPEPEWAVIDGVCAQAFGSLIGAVDRSDITVLSQVFTEDPGWGWADEGSYHTACFAQTAQLITKSVVGIDSTPLR